MVIGIGGVSRSGKTVLAHWLADRLMDQGYKVTVLHQDELVVSSEKLPLINGLIDWEHPSSMDFQKIMDQIKEAEKTSDFILVDGLFAFANDSLNEHYSKGIYLHIDRDTFMKRKLADDRWGGEPLWFLSHIWDAHQIYGVPGNVNFPLLQLEGTDIRFEKALEFIKL
jgi:nicotinamide/nicotinate riboside kinase